MIVIRAIADTPMNENRPDNVFSLLSYLNREQYGDRPLLYGQYFNAPVEDQETKYTYVQKNERYEKIPMTNPEYKYSSEYSTIFPRMYSHQSSHISGYKSWVNIKDDEKKPSFLKNLGFFFGYQINHMYIRYFMWNFAGRQNDLQGHGDNLKGNWLSGIPFIDNLRLGPQDKLPPSMKSNKARNNYYMLPLILGLIGLIYLYQKRPKQFVVVLLLFFFTGIAIVIYLKPDPLSASRARLCLCRFVLCFCHLDWSGCNCHCRLAKKTHTFNCGCCSCHRLDFDLGSRNHGKRKLG
jgi:hypothetical protein